MKKLKLQLDMLAVQSFTAQRDPTPRSGTVAAHEVTQYADTCRGTTCDQSCYPQVNTNCVCEPDTYSPTWNVATCITGECQCYNSAPC